MSVAHVERSSEERRDTSQRSVTAIMLDAVGEFTTLFRSEAQLARAEVSDKVGQAAAGLGLLVGGAVLLIPALVILLGAAVSGLMSQGIPSYWSALIIGGAVFIIGLIIAAIGSTRLRPASLTPTRTIEQLQRDAAVAKAQRR
jgi:hypothetical protein